MSIIRTLDRLVSIAAIHMSRSLRHKWPMGTTRVTGSISEVCCPSFFPWDSYQPHKRCLKLSSITSARLEPHQHSVFGKTRFNTR
jgi:hypothetical protein